MEKLVYTVWRAADADTAALARAVLEDAAPALLHLGVHGLRVNVEEPAGAILQQGARADGRRLAATVSVWLDSLDQRAPHEQALRDAGLDVDGYLVCESVPRGYGERRTWPDGERSPGLSLMTVFDRKPGVDDATFYGIWHGEHTPLSFEIHPLWLYVRNAVVRPVTAGALPLAGIVYEAVPADDDMLDLHRFFGSDGSKERLSAQMTRVMTHMDTFADLAGLVTTPAREWILKTLPAGT